MKKILIFSLAYYPDFVGGAEVAIKEITDRVPPKEASFDMVTAKLNSNQKRFEKIGNVNVYRVGLGLETFDKFAISTFGFLKALSLHKKNKYDVSWAVMANQAAVAASVFKFFCKKVPLVLTIQEGDEEEYLKRYVFGNNFLYKILIKPWHTMPFRFADRAITLSTYLKKRVEQNNFKGPIDIIPNGVDLKNFTKNYQEDKLDALREKLEIKNDEKTIITTSRLVDKNAINDIISSLSHLPKKYKLLILGTGPLLYKLQNLAEKEGVYNRVKFLGFVDNKEIPKYLKISDYFVRPSISEGMGNSFIESFAAGIPVIATPVGGITDFLVDEETGLFCEIRNPESIAERIKFLEKNSELREKIILKAKEASKGYDWNLIAKIMSKKVFVLQSGCIQKIVISSGIFPPQIGGPAYYAWNLSKELKGMGHDVKAVSYGIESKLPSGIRHLAYFFRLLFNSFGADFILALDTLSVGLPSVWVKNTLGKKLLIRIGGDFLWEDYVNRKEGEVVLSDFYNHKGSFSKRSRKIFNLTNYVLNNADAIIFSTKWQENIFNKVYNLEAEKSHIVENFYGEKNKSQNYKRKNFLWAGRKIILKNIKRTEQAFVKAKEIQKDIELDVLSGFKREELLRKISECYAVILPSFSEVSPNLIMEAISFNKPFIMTEDTGIHDRVGDIGIFISPLSEENIKEKILFLSDEVSYKEQKAKIEGFNFAHSYKEIAEEILNISKKI